MVATTRFLTEAAIVAALHHRMKRTTECRVAVSYCGSAAHRFFPELEADRPEDLRILVDASPSAVARGLTSPEGLTRLLGLTTHVKWLQGLHAKMFVFGDEAAIVSSLNLSAGSVDHQRQALLETSESA